MKIMVHFEAQVWKRGSRIAPSIFSLIFLNGFLASLFLFGFFGLFYFDFLTWDDALIMKIITLLFTYNSKLQLDTRTKICPYMNASAGVPGCAVTQE